MRFRDFRWKRGFFDATCAAIALLLIVSGPVGKSCAALPTGFESLLWGVEYYVLFAVPSFAPTPYILIPIIFFALLMTFFAFIEKLRKPAVLNWKSVSLYLGMACLLGVAGGFYQQSLTQPTQHACFP